MFPGGIQRTLRTHRRLVAALLAGCAALIAVSIVRPEPPETTAIVVARHSLAAGHVITDSDVSIAQWPTAIGAPPTARAISDVQGRTTAGPVGAGEPLSQARLVGPGLLELVTLTGAADASHLVAAPIRLADAGQAALIRPGDTVDVIAARAIDGGGQSADQVATDARVITITDASHPDGGLLGSTDGPATGSTDPGSLIVLAVSTDTAKDLAAAATRSRISVVLKPPRPTPSTTSTKT